MVVRGGDWGGRGKSGQKLQNSSHKINKSWGYNIQHDRYS